MIESRTPDVPLSPAAAAFADIIESAQPVADGRAGQLAARCFLGASEGHSCLDAATCFPAADAAAALTALFEGNRLVMTASGPDQDLGPCLLVIFRDRLYLKKYWLLETALIRHVRMRTNALPMPDHADASARLASCCLDKPLCLLTGGPGTGKTTAISGALMHWIAAFHARHDRIPQIRLCAPTGKAAARMNEAWQRQKAALLHALPPVLQAALPETALTLHRLLAIAPIGRQGRYRPDRPLAADLLVFDEASMIDLPMTVQLFDALPASCHVLLVGDPEQLPSIEIGSVLNALISLPEGSKLQKRLASAHIRLQQNHRQSESPGLSGLGHDVLNATAEAVENRLVAGAYDDVRFQESARQALTAVVEDAVRHYRAVAAQPGIEQAMAMLGQHMVLSPVRIGPSGCVTLNARIGNAMATNPDVHGHVLMVTENMPAMGLSNGDIGIVWRCPDGPKAHFQTGGRMFSVALAGLPRHEPAYALTVHKAQGSEFGHVDFVLPETDSPLLDKPLFYTAVTRARESLRITAAPGMLSAILRRDSRRMNGLSALAGSTQQEVQ